MFISNKIVLPFVYWDNCPFGDQDEHSDLIYIHISDYQKITGRLQDDSPLFFKMFCKKNVFSSPNNIVVRIGGFHNEDPKHIYVPQWMINQLQWKPFPLTEEEEDLNSSNGFYPKANLMQLWDIPLATEIQIQNLNPEVLSKYEGHMLDVRSIYEQALSSYGGVDFHKIIPLLLRVDEETLSINVLISKIEPLPLNGYVRFDGDVTLDIKEPPQAWNPETEISQEEEDASQEFSRHPEIISAPLTREELRQARLKFFDIK
jgi:hypothetical protein